MGRPRRGAFCADEYVYGSQVMTNTSLMERVLWPPGNAGSAGTVLVPLDNHTVFVTLANEAAHMAVSLAGNGLVLVVDGDTARSVEGVAAARDAARSVLVVGEVPPSWRGASHVTRVCARAGAHAGERFLVVHSAEINLGLVGVLEAAGREEEQFRGGWTGQRAHVEHIVDSVLDGSARPPFEPPDGGAADVSTASTMRLAALLTKHLSSVQYTAAMDKHDLASVLDILKAISAERRSHDVLYVFVEKIVRVVEAKRCSVVRVWDGEDKGHVLASHENQLVKDLVIELDKYPEIRRALEDRGKVVINDVFREPLTRAFADLLESAGIRSLIVVPIVLSDPNVGSLFLRAARAGGGFTPREVSFCEVVCEAASNALERAQLFESMQRANERLERLAITDGLTGLFNHRYFQERLRQEFERAKRYTLPLSCLMLDIDNFKDINDGYGHMQGDSVLREMAARILRTTRRIDVAARYGGEEFAVIMPQTGFAGAKSEGTRLLHELSRPYPGLPSDIQVTVSIGMAVQEHDGMETAEELVRVADKALYEAKGQGKNRMVVGTLQGGAS